MITFNVDNFTTGIQLATLNELIHKVVVTHPQLRDYHAVTTGIAGRKQIAFVNSFGLVGKKLVGCTVSESDEQLIFTNKFWEFNPIGDRLSFCSATISADVQLFERVSRMMPDWFTNMRAKGQIGDKLALIVVKATEAILRSQNIKNWFSDTEAKTVSNGGTLTNGTDVAYFDIFEGLYKQLSADFPTTSAQYVAIPQNSGSDKAAQYNFNRGDATAILRKMHRALTKQAKQAIANGATFVFHATSDFAEAYEDDIEAVSAENNQNNPSRQETGVKRLFFKGIEVIKRYDISSTIEMYYDNGTTYHLPNRVLLTMKENIPVGVLNESELSELDVFPVKKDKKVYLDFAYSQDVKHLQPELSVYAY